MGTDDRADFKKYFGFCNVSLFSVMRADRAKSSKTVVTHIFQGQSVKRCDLKSFENIVQNFESGPGICT